MIREARADQAQSLAAIQRDASLAGYAHIFPPELYPYPTGVVARLEVHEPPGVRDEVQPFGRATDEDDLPV